MEYLIQIFLPVSIWFQNSPDWLISIMKALTFLGDTEFYLLVMPLLYWCIDLALGIRIGVILLVSGSLNTILKFAFTWPRPFWISPQVDPVVGAEGFGFPSGHAQNAASIWGLFAVSRPQRWQKLIALGLIFLIGLSRIILGVHFTHDVLGGWVIGLVLLFLFLMWESRVIAWFKKSSWGLQVLVLILITGAFLITAILIANPLNPPPLPGTWSGPDGEILTPFNYDGLLTTLGAFFGLGLGVILLYQTGWFQVKAPTWKLVVRYLVGLVGVLILYLGLGSIFPDDLDILSFSLRFLRYFLIGFWISYGGPKFFQWVKLAEKRV